MADASTGGPLARLGVRARLTLLTTLALATVLSLAGFAVVLLAGSALRASLDDAAQVRADEIAGLLVQGPLPEPLPVTGAAVVQVVDGSGRVLASSPGGDRLSPLLDADRLASVRDGGAVALDGSRVGSPEPFRVVGREAGPDRSATVLVASSLAEVERGIGVVRTGVLLTVPLLVAALALVVWRVSGSALRPVEDLRRGAATVGAGGEAGPLPVPAAGDEVGRLAVTLNEMLARLDAASTRQRAFVVDAAHELRSPLGSVRTQLEVALAHPTQVDWPAVATGSLADVERVQALVDALLLLARIGSSPVAAERVDLLAVARTAAGRPRRLPVDVAGAGGATQGDPRALTRVVDNLLDNAVRHAAAKVTVDVVSRNGAVHVVVQDDGPGIAPRDRERVFARFTRLDDARDRDSGGSGLGLAIVRAVIEQHGGTVRIEDRLDGRPGTRVLVALVAAAGPEPSVGASAPDSP